MSTGVVVVTGASRGIGAATARLAAAEGHAVIVNYARNEAAAGQVVADIRAAGGVAEAVRADVAAPAEVEQLFAAADRLGRLVGLVNNAAINTPSMRLEAVSEELLGELFATNIVGPFLCAQAAIRRMSSRHGGQGGAIVNVSSAAAKHGSPGVGVAYATSKGAMDSLTIGLAGEVGGEGIRVNAVRPGVTLTDMNDMSRDGPRIEAALKTIPLGRPAEPEEIAAPIVWLLSDAASYCNGAIMMATGGRAVFA